MNKKYISRNYVNGNVVRLVALQVIIVTLLALFYHHSFLLVILALDFAFRSFAHLPSPLALFGKAVSKALGQNAKPVFAPPKRFAATIGFFLSLVTSAFLFTGFESIAYSTGGVLVFCALLESAFNVCVGCYLYDWLIAPVVNKNQESHQASIKA